MQIVSTTLQALIRGEQVEGYTIISRKFLRQNAWKKVFDLVFEYNGVKYHSEYDVGNPFMVEIEEVEE